MPRMVIEDDNFINIMLTDIESSNIPYNKFALEVYSDLLFEKNSKTFKEIEALREKGFKILLLHYASKNLPMSEISYMPADTICFDEFLTSCITSGDSN